MILCADQVLQVMQQDEASGMRNYGDAEVPHQQYVIIAFYEILALNRHVSAIETPFFGETTSEIRY